MPVSRRAPSIGGSTLAIQPRSEPSKKRDGDALHTDRQILIFDCTEAFSPILRSERPSGRCPTPRTTPPAFIFSGRGEA